MCPHAPQDVGAFMPVYIVTMQVIKDHVSATQDNSRQLELQCSIADVPMSLGRANTIFIHPFDTTTECSLNTNQTKYENPE